MNSTKTGDKKTDKALDQVSREVDKKQPAIETKTGSLKSGQLNNGELSFAVVKASSEGPGAPSQDEGRLYFKIDGVMYKLTGVKVG
tara:strand:- start:10090 stop:10347 length:258 start_codon:yes stop_codon:yes gene_type:complete